MQRLGDKSVLSTMFKDAVHCWIPKYKKLNENKHKARGAVRAAVLRGDLVRPESCSSCGRSGCPIEAHHPDYERHLYIQWLCKKCHYREDRVMKLETKIELYQIFLRRHELLPQAYPPAWYGPDAPEMKRPKDVRIRKHAERRIVKMQAQLEKIRSSRSVSSP